MGCAQPAPASAPDLRDGRVIALGKHTRQLLTASTSIDNDGTLELTTTSPGNSEPGIYMVSGTLTNTGTIISDQGNSGDSTSPNEIGVSLANEGNVDIETDTVLDQHAGTYDDEAGGNITVAPGATLTVTPPDGQGPTDSTHVFDLDGGTIANNGTFIDPGGTFNHNGGTATGNPIDLTGVALNPSLDDGAGTGSATFFVFGAGGAGNTLIGNVAASDTILLAVQDGGIFGGGNDATLTATSSLTNAGTIELTGTTANGFVAQLFGASGTTLTNTGTIETLPGSSGTYEIGTSLTNEGALDIGTDTYLDADETSPAFPVYDNETGGNITIAENATLTVTPPDGQGPVNSTHVFDLDGGTITNNGTFLDPGGTFNHNGGTATGNPIVLTDAALDPSLAGGTGTGSATFQVFGPDNTLIGNVAASDTILLHVQDTTLYGVGGDATMNVNSSLTNAGKIELSGTTALSYVVAQLVASGTTLTNTGTIDSVSDGGGSLDIYGDLANEGTLDLGTATTSLSGNFTQGAAGSLDIAVDGTAAGEFSAFDVSGTDGNATLDGTLAIQPGTAYVGSAAAGDSMAFLSYTGARTGTFSVAGVSPQNTALPVISGTPAFGQQLSCSEGSFTDSPTTFAYQWDRDGAPIPGATASTYTLETSDVGQSLTCTVTASGATPLDGGDGFSPVYANPGQVDVVVGPTFASIPTAATSAAVGIVGPPQVLSAPTVSGTPEVGDVLNCSEGGWEFSPSSFSYRWNRGGAPISGATASTYTLQGADAGTSITCTVTATNAAGSTPATSAAIAVAPPITVSPGTLPQATGANPYSEALSASGGSSKGYSFSLTSGALPPGLSLSSTGVVSGTPTEAGTFSFAVDVSDSAGATGTSPTYAFTVVPGLAIRTTNGSYVAGGAIPASEATVLPDGSGAISSVTMSSGSTTPYVPVGGSSSSADNEVGVELATTGSTCTTNLDVAGSGGEVFTADGLLTAGCAASSSGAVSPALSQRHALVAHASSSGSARTTVTGGGLVRSHGAMLSGTVQVVSIGSSQTETTESTGTLAADNPFDVTGSSTMGPTHVAVAGGTYASELNGSLQTTSFTITALTTSTGSLPTLLPVTPLATLINSDASGAATQGRVSAGAAGGRDTALLGADGFPTGTQAEEILPSLSSSTSGDAVTQSSVLGDLESENQSLGLSDRGSLVAALEQDVGDGVFDGKPTGQPVPLGSATLPVSAGTGLFSAGISRFSAAQARTVPPLVPAVQSIVQTLPMLPVAAPAIGAVSGTVTRIGPAAFSETISTTSPSYAAPPFSNSSDSFDLEVVAAT